MKSKLLKDISHFLGVLMAVVLVMTYTSCSDEDTTDTTGFALYYLGMTDIGPSMSGIISEPSYKGSVPSDFTITSITLNGEPYMGSDFIINEYDKVFDEFDKEVGFNYLRGMHLNDSKKALGTHVDRHDSIGEGLIGKAFFERLMQDSRFDNIPLILETPDESKWKEEIAWLRSME